MLKSLNFQTDKAEPFLFPSRPFETEVFVLPRYPCSWNYRGTQRNVRRWHEYNPMRHSLGDAGNQECRGHGEPPSMSLSLVNLGAGRGYWEPPLSYSAGGMKSCPREQPSGVSELFIPTDLLISANCKEFLNDSWQGWSSRNDCWWLMNNLGEIPKAPERLTPAWVFSARPQRTAWEQVQEEPQFIWANRENTACADTNVSPRRAPFPKTVHRECYLTLRCSAMGRIIHGRARFGRARFGRAIIFQRKNQWCEV